MDPLWRLRAGLGGVLAWPRAFPALLRVGFVCACSALAALAATAQPAPRLSDEADQDDLIAAMGCASCHTDLPSRSSLRERTPDLSFAGSRYQPDYLFQFLQNPVKVRRHLGRARMPDFHLSPQEALALTAFLETQRALPAPAVAPDWPMPAADAAVPAAGTAEEARTVMTAEGLLCLNCHTWAGQGGAMGVELSRVSVRLKPDWVLQFLAAPHLFGVASGVMPAQFFESTDQGFKELQSGAAEKLRKVSQALFRQDAAERDQTRAAWEAARAAFPQADARQGETLFRAFNCAACHKINRIEPRTEAAPELARLTERIIPAWLQNYLTNHVPIRPFGYLPGDGGRMPDFRLHTEEAAEVTRLLVGGREPGLQQPTLGTKEPPRKLSAFSKRKARLLLTEKLSCLGCHRLDGRGGRIGPDLSNVPSRLQPEYVLQMIKDPKRANPHSTMPRLPLDETSTRLIADFLIQQGPSKVVVKEAYLSPMEFPLIASPANPPADAVRAQAGLNYAKYCAPCHGNTGRGDGFNASFMPVKPTAHADAVYMATRPDDTLYDGIHSGGAILNKSPFMPAWGGVFSPNEIKALVGWMRTLCHCQGPAWSER